MQTGHKFLNYRGIASRSKCEGEKLYRKINRRLASIVEFQE